jgi:mediator of RNA polymerase II transcription subunit 13
MEAQAVHVSSTNGGDMTSISPSIQPIEITDQHLSPVTTTSFEGASHLQSSSLIDDTRPKILPESIKETSQIISPVTSSQSIVPFSEKHNHLTKVEAMLAFAPEYAAIEFPTANENVVSPFSNPYQPSRKADSSGSSTMNSYVYNATPPPPRPDASEEKGEASSELYTLVVSGKKESDKISNDSNNTEVNSSKSDVPPPALSDMTSLSTSTSLTKKNENTINSDHFLLPTKLALATDMDCIMYQAAMCRVRHTLISLKSKTPVVASSKFEVKKKETINMPVRIGGDMECELITHDGSLTSQVGVWRSVGGPKSLKPCGSSLPDESLAVNAYQRQPLMDFLSALGLLVQQSASFVDVALDANSGEGSYGWLALQEQRRRGFPCEPDTAHAGCGGLLAMCHSVDLAGVYLVDPLAADVRLSLHFLNFICCRSIVLVNRFFLCFFIASGCTCILKFVSSSMWVLVDKRS